MRWISAVLMCGMLTVGLGQAAASTNDYGTVFVQFKLERNSSKRTFSGQIQSSTSKCTKGRAVEVIRKNSGKQQTLGKDGTSGNGKFSISIPTAQAKKGTYFAKVKFKKYDNGKNLCRSAQSGTIKLS